MTKDLNFIETIMEEFGEDVFSRESAGEFIPTGCLSLDVSIGTGGIPVGRFTEIYGSEGAGKTTIALSIARKAIKLGKKVLYVDAENMLDVALIPDILGEAFPEDMFVLIQPDTAEAVLTIIEHGIESGEFGLIVLDSIGALAPEVEKEKDLDEMQMGTTPKLLAKFFRRNSYAVRHSNTAVLLINQVRDNIGSYSKGFTVPGGHALKHFCAVIISLSKGQEIKQNSEAVGITTTFVIKKNKLSAPFRGYTLPIIFGQGVDYYKDLLNFTEDIGVVAKAGPYYKFQEVQLGKGVVNSIEFLKNNPETLDRIVKQVYNVTSNKADLLGTTANQIIEDVILGKEEELG
jgi:recombination protein RecA